MRYRLLTTTQAVRDDGTAVPLGGARLRALLTVLALRPGRTVPVGVLVDEVWDGEPPADEAGALQALVARLRRALGPGAVASDDGGYRLCADSDDVDLYRFERLAGEGTRALEAGDPVKAAALLEDALGLWQGEALADLPDRTALAARWEARRLEALRASLAAAVELGRPEEALPELGALCDEHPLDEPLQVLRIRALRAAGRTAQALEAYEGVRRGLAEELGADPGPELRSLHAELLAPPPPWGVAAGPGPQSPDGLNFAGPGFDARADTAHRNGPQGYEGAGQNQAHGPQGHAGAGRIQTHGPHVQADVGQNQASPAIEERGSGGSAPGAAEPQRPGNLRSRLTSFVGRERDIDALRGDLGRARLVTLLGPGGAGKTRLSQEAAEATADTWPDGVWLAELAPVDDPDNVAEAVLAALGARETVLHGAGAEKMRAVQDRKSGDPLAKLAAHCARRRMLILLDNCEHVIGAAARLADELLARCPELTILATSREPLGVPGELLHPLEPLPQPTALRLFAERGAAARAGFRTDEDPEAAAEICRRLDGLPLAIELAAARLRMLTPRQIADRLDDRFRLLTGGARTVLPRQQTLRAVVDWSWDLLGEDERSVLCGLSVFAGGCDLAAAEAVCGPDSMDALGSLVDKSLVVTAPSADSGMRYRLLETVAEYAAERLDESGERADTERRHLVYFREMARAEDPKLRGSGQREAIAALEREYENLRTAVRRAVAARDEHEALCLIHALHGFWQMRGQRSEIRHWSAAIAELGPDPFAADPVELAPALYERCTDTPPPMSSEQLMEARRGVRLIQLASSDQDTERWSSPAMAKLATGIRAAYRPGLPQTCRPPANMWFFAVLLTGNADDLRGMIDATVETSRELGYVWELANALEMRANVLANRSEWAGDADRDAEESLELFTALGDDWGVAEALSARGEARERRGEYALAVEDFKAAVGYAESLGAKAQMSILQVRLAGVMAEMGEGEAGEVLLREVLAQGPRVGTEANPAARIFLAMWLGRTGRTDEARVHLEELSKEFTKGSFSVFDGFVVGIRAHLSSVDGDHDTAWALAVDALKLADDPLTEMVAPQMPPVYLRIIARSMAGLGGTELGVKAAQLIGASDGLLSPSHVPTAVERETRDAAESATRAVLGDAAYETAHAEGGSLSKEEATALARRDRREP
ncbi:BTAD domain-containing putative transcriptional regulator [Streptomyces sp. NPDC050738]|uniref:AfsR/SARP family transcriptional regulator n=1 Tax=Streptomyces sp. NPDC050738 TaxID=3154744 RepID=UPI0034320855